MDENGEALKIPYVDMWRPLNLTVFPVFHQFFTVLHARAARAAREEPVRISLEIKGLQIPPAGYIEIA